MSRIVLRMALIAGLGAACGDDAETDGSAGGGGSASVAMGGAVSGPSSGGTSNGGGSPVTATGTTGTQGMASSGTGAPMPSPGCNLAATSGTTTRHLTVMGVDRTFTQVIPANYDPTVAHAVIMRFHGLGATGAAAVGGIGLATAPTIMVGPDANPPAGAWSTSGDLALVDAIMATLANELCIDLERNFATGYSNGGFMADAVGCKRSETFRGIAIQEGGTGASGCGQVGVMILHNQNDMSVPISYGTSLRDKWLATNTCAATSQPIAPAPCVAYDGCAAGHPVLWCSPETGGHNPNYEVSLGIGPFFDTL